MDKTNKLKNEELENQNQIAQTFLYMFEPFDSNSGRNQIAQTDIKLKTGSIKKEEQISEKVVSRTPKDEPYELGETKGKGEEQWRQSQ